MWSPPLLLDLVMICLSLYITWPVLVTIGVPGSHSRVSCCLPCLSQLFWIERRLDLESDNLAKHFRSTIMWLWTGHLISPVSLLIKMPEAKDGMFWRLAKVMHGKTVLVSGTHFFLQNHCIRLYLGNLASKLFISPFHVFVFLFWPHIFMWDLSSLARNQTHVSSSGSKDS